MGAMGASLARILRGRPGKTHTKIELWREASVHSQSRNSTVPTLLSLSFDLSSLSANIIISPDAWCDGIEVIIVRPVTKVG